MAVTVVAIMVIVCAHHGLWPSFSNPVYTDVPCKFSFYLFGVIYVNFMQIYVVYSWLHNDLQVALIGPKLDLTYDYEASLFRLFFTAQHSKGGIVYSSVRLYVSLCVSMIICESLEMSS